MSTRMSNAMFVRGPIRFEATSLTPGNGLVVRIESEYDNLLTIFFDSWQGADNFAHNFCQAVDSIQPPEEDEGPETPIVPPISEPAEEVLA